MGKSQFDRAAFWSTGGVLNRKKDEWIEANRDALVSAFGEDLTSKQINAAYKYRDQIDSQYWHLLNSKGKKNGGGMLASDIMAMQESEKQNSYSHEVQSMIDAGINPVALSTGGSSASPAASGGDVQSNQTTGAEDSNAIMQSIAGLMGIASSVQQLRQSQANIDNIAADTRKKEAERDNILADTKNKGNTDEWYQLTKDYDLKLKSTGVTASELDNDSKSIANYINRQSADFQIDTAKWNTVSAQFNAKIAETDAKYRGQLAELQLALGEASIAKNYAECDKIEQEIIKLAKECDILDRDASSYEERLMLDYVGGMALLMNASTAAYNTSISAAGMGGIGEQFTTELGDYRGISGNILTTFKDRFGDTGLYHTETPKGASYGGITTNTYEKNTQATAKKVEQTQPQNVNKKTAVQSYLELHGDKVRFDEMKPTFGATMFQSNIGFYKDSNGNERWRGNVRYKDSSGEWKKAYVNCSANQRYQMKH